jgi:hypothetical protein
VNAALSSVPPVSNVNNAASPEFAKAEEKQVHSSNNISNEIDSLSSSSGDFEDNDSESLSSLNFKK